MNNYTLSVNKVSFEKDNGDVSLVITLKGSFPQPVNTIGNLVNDTIQFDLTSESGATVDEAVFTFQMGEGYPGDFEFINYPQGYGDAPINGDVNADNNEECDFELVDCVWGVNPTGGLGSGEGKSLQVSVKKKPGVTSYEISSFLLTEVEISGAMQLSAVMTLHEAAEDQLEATCEELVNFNEIGQALPIVTVNESGDSTPRSIGVIYVNG
ncbi:hypothetical protein [Owenweeksia hongkongensis]|uniref:hypothetical protein n=1 Tax=Owenweeksia hongkongensis TaxID=253245 RepID=UPI003A94824E